MFEEVVLVGWMLLILFVGAVSLILGKKYGIGIAIGTFAGLTVIANIIAVKPVMFGPFVVPAAVIIYATTFLMTDVLAEHWGKETAFQAVISGFVANIMLVLGVTLAIWWPGAVFWENQEALQMILGLAPRVVLASMTAYLISQNHDIWAFHFWKRKTKGKYLWLRNNASTAVSQLIDTTLFITIAFYGILPIVPLIIGQYVVKLIIAAIDTPFCYATVNIIQKIKPREMPSILAPVGK